VSLISSLLQPKPKRTDTSNPPNSSYGADLPRLFGLCRIGTTLVYAPQVYYKKRGGKGALTGKNNGDKYYATFQVGIGEGERAFQQYINSPPAIPPVTDPPFRVRLNSLPNEGVATVTEFKEDGNTVVFNPFTATGGTSLSSGAITLGGAVAGKIDASSDVSVPVTGIVSYTFKVYVDTTVTPSTTNKNLLVEWVRASGGDLQVIIGNASFLNQTTYVWLDFNPPLNTLKIYYSQGGIKPGSPQSTIGLSTSLYTQPSTPGIDYSGKLALRKIYLNDKIWYDETDQATTTLKKDSIQRKKYFTFYNGSQTQLQDPTLVARLGANNVSALQGISYIVFKDLDVSDGGGNIPTVRVEVESDLPAKPSFILRDATTRAGIQKNRPLLEGKDWVFGVNPDTLSNVNIDGYILSQDNIEMRNPIQEVCQVFKLAMTQSNEAWIGAPNFFRAGKSVNFCYPENTLSVWPLEGYSPQNAFESDKLGGDTTEYNLPQAYSFSQKDIDAFPAQVDVSYMQPKINFERETVIAHRASQNFAESKTISLNAVIADRSTATNIAVYLLRQGWQAMHQFTAKLAYNLLPNQLNSPQGVGTWQPTTVEIGADGRSQVTSIVLSTNVAPLVYTPSQTGVTGGYVSTASDAEIIWFDGQSLDGSASRSVYVLLSTPDRGNSQGAFNLFYSGDGGATYTTLDSNAYAVNSIHVPVTISNVMDNSSSLYVLDKQTKLTVTVPDGYSLASITEEQLFNFSANLIYSPSFGVVSYAKATLTGANTYELSTLLWNVLESGFDKQYVRANGSVDAYLLTSNPHQVLVPNSVPNDSSLTLGVGGTDGVVYSYTDTFRDRNAAPRPPLDATVKLALDGSLLLSWSDGLSQNTTTAATLLEEESSTLSALAAYSVYVYAKSGATYTFKNTYEVTTKSFAYTTAMQSADSTSPLTTYFEVIQKGSIATQMSNKTNLVGLV
jgi:Putative phage tail protein